MEERVLQKLLLDALNKLPGVYCWRNNTGVARGHIRFGIAGQGDISGLIAGGRRLEIEVKNEKYQQNDDQKKFQQRIEALGGLYILARDLESTLRAVQDAVNQATRRCG